MAIENEDKKETVAVEEPPKDPNNGPDAPVDPSKEQSIDYAAALEAERALRKDAEDKLKDAENLIAGKKYRENHRSDDIETIPENEADKPLTLKELDGILASRDQRLIRETRSGEIAQIARSLSASDAEAQLTVEIHRNRTWPASLSLQQQLEEANAIANRKRLVSQTSELARGLNSRETALRDTGSVVRDPMKASKPEVSASDAEAYKRANFTYDEARKVYVKKLPNGQHLYKDPVTKRTWAAA